MPGVGSMSLHGTSIAALGASSVGHGARPASGPARRPGTTPRTTQATASAATAVHMGSGASTASATRVRRGRPSSTSPTTLTKQSTARAAVAPRAASAMAPATPTATPPLAGTASSDCSVSHSEANPFRRRQPGDRHRADEEGQPGPRHPVQKAADPVDLERARRALERPGAEEEEALEDGVIERVQERGRERDAGPVVRSALAEQETRSEAEHDDPDVLDRVEREQSLQLVLEDRVHDADNGGEGAGGEDDDPEPRRQRAVGPLDEDADEAVDRELDHHAAHQRRHVRRGDRVGAREPDVQRDEPRLRSHADQRCERDRDLRARPGLERASSAERVGVREEQHRDPRAGAHEVRQGDVDVDRASRGAVVPP